MSSLKFQKKISKLVHSGEVLEALHELNRPAARGDLDFALLQVWLEILSSTGIASVDSAISATRGARRGVEEQLIVDSFVAVERWVRQDRGGLAELIVKYRDFVRPARETKESVNAQTHLKLCMRLLADRLQATGSQSGTADGQLVTIGDSHCLVPVGLTIQWRGRRSEVIAAPIRGIKMFHLGETGPRKYRGYFSERVKRVPPDADVLLSIGEIDCRPNEGIFPAALKQPGQPLRQFIDKTLDEFVAFAQRELRAASTGVRSVTLLGVPVPAYEIEPRLPAPNTTREQFIDFIAQVNEAMRARAHNAGWDFLDVHSATNGPDAQQGQHRLDDIHLSPTFYAVADGWRTAATDRRTLAPALTLPPETRPSALEARKSVVRLSARDNSAGPAYGFDAAAWQIIDLGNPVRVSTAADFNGIDDGSVDAIIADDVLPLFFAHQIPAVLGAWRRVLKEEGYVVVVCPDLQAAAQFVSEDKLTEAVYNGADGAVTPLDILYGPRALVSAGAPHVARKCGFTLKVLSGTLQANGFKTTAGFRRRATFELWVIATKNPMGDDAIRQLAARHFPP